MANVVGEPLNNYVIDQITARQFLHGSGGREGIRNDTQINLLNSNTSWVKLASGVSVDSKRLKDAGINASLDGMELAKTYVLNSGISKLGVSEYGNPQLQQQQGFLPQDPHSSYTYGSYGYSPMPGITSVDIKTLGRGSLKKATVKLLANNIQQFNIIDLLYLRLGYTVLLEWGNSMYTPDGNQRKIVRNTLIEEQFFSKSAKGSYLDMLKPIERKRAYYNGNYDGLLGKVSNFSWTFKEDGSYEIELTIISLGDVIESLKTNISVDQKTNEFLGNTTGTVLSPDEQSEEPNLIEEYKDANTITSMLYIWKYLNNQPESIGDDIKIITENSPEGHIVGGFLSSTQGENEETITSVRYEYEFYIEGERAFENSRGVTYEPIFETKKQWFTKTQIDNDEPDAYAQKLYKDYKASDRGITNLRVPYKRLTKASGNITTIKNPIKGSPKKSAFAFKTKPNLQYYLRFGYLLEYIRDNVLIKIKIGEDHDKNPPIFDIDFATWSNHMYSLPNQISLDPRVCVVRNDKFSNLQTPKPTQVFSKLSIFREIDNGDSTNENAAYPMNIYLNFNFIIECLKTDERGDVNVFEFLKSICDGLNKALGGINNLEPIIDESSNILKILDTTPIPGYSGIDGTKKYTLQLYGYDKTKTSYISNFIRKVDLKTAITPEFATMVTVGATAGGYVKGVEATAFSRWNWGLTDRFKEEFTPGNLASITPPGTPDEAEVNYVNKFLSKEGYTTRYGFTSLSRGNLKLSDDIIEGNISVGTEFFKYIVAKNKSTSGGTIGFIPFKISFTMDGLSGIKIYNKLNVDTRFLPKAYGDTLDLIVTGVSHKLSNNDWETDIEATVIPKTTSGGVSTITSQTIQTVIQEVKNAPTNVSPGGSNLVQGQSVIDVLLKFLDTAGIPKTPENIKFVKAWKQAETTKAKNSLFGSTQKYNNSTRFNGAGVQNYNSIEDSIKAHTKTIQNKYYPNLYKDLKAGKKTALQIAQDNLKELKTWGTGGLLLTVLKGGVKDNNLKIYS